MKKFRKILAVTLALMMVMASLSLTAFAEAHTHKSDCAPVHSHDLEDILKALDLYVQIDSPAAAEDASAVLSAVLSDDYGIFIGEYLIYDTVFEGETHYASVPGYIDGLCTDDCCALEDGCGLKAGDPEPSDDDDTPATYTITAPDNGHTYEVYQIFTGDINDLELQNIRWGVNGTGTTGDGVPAAILQELLAVEGSTDNDEKLAVIEKYVNLSSPIETIESGESVEVAGGYYLILDKAGTIPDEDIEPADAFYTTYIVKIVKDLEIEPKGSVPTVTKEIVEDGGEAQVNEASVGDVIPYRFTGTMPSAIDDYETYYYVFTDTLSEGLDFNDDVVVTIDGFDVTDYFYINDAAGTDNSTVITVGIQDLLALECPVADTSEGAAEGAMKPAVVSIDADTTVVVTYSATVNENASIGTDPNTNTVILDFYNDPNHSGTPSTNPPSENPTDPPAPGEDIPTGETPESTTETYVTEITLFKVDESGASLTGAEFELTGDMHKVKIVIADTFEEDENGTYYKLLDGTYTKEAPHTEEYMVEDEEGGYVLYMGVATESAIITVGGTDYVAYDEEHDAGKTRFTRMSANSELYANDGKKYTKTSGSRWVDSTAEGATIKAFVGEDGVLTFSGLGAGTYTLSETTTPAGYNKIDDIEIVIGFNATNKEFTTESNDVTITDNKASITVVNKSGAVLPSTGGVGTTLFYVIGGILLVGAGVLLITKKRMGANN